eukprot:287253_1
MLPLLLLLVLTHSAEVILNTQLGQIQGTEHPVEGVYSFFGIQYGNSPTGSLRFRPAQLNNSKWNGIYNGTQFGQVCMMLDLLVPFFGNQSMSENCLFLNIWTTKKSSANLPVMVFIVGGGFVVGAGSEASYNGLRFVSEYKDVVYVSINYRLGAFGFLQNEQLYNEDASWKSYGGQNGINDQIVALQWIKKYISDYGGNPNQITIFGQSAGGLSVCNLLVSPLASGLFQRAIIESGGCTAGWSAKNQSYGLQEWNKYLQKAGYPIDNMTYLRSINAKEFNDKMKLDETKMWQGSVDGMVLTDLPVNLYTKLNVFNVDKLIIGFNTLDSASAFPWHLGPRPTTQDEYIQYLTYYVPNSKNNNLLYETYYPPSDFAPYPFPEHNSYELGWFTIQADCCIVCSSLFIADQISNKIGTDIVYVYQFGGPGKNGSYYAPHGSELPFVFNIPEEDHAFDMSWDQELSNQMVSAWTDLAAYGSPNISTDKTQFEWNLYAEKGKENSDVMIFRDTIKMQTDFETNYRRNVCDFWFSMDNHIDIMSNICNSKRNLTSFR